MNHRKYGIYLALVAVSFALSPYSTHAQEASSAQVKAAQIYNYLLYTDWSEELEPKSDEVVTIGILGRDIFGDIFSPIEGIEIKNRTLAIRKFEEDTVLDSLAQCDVIYFVDFDKSRHKTLLKGLAEEHVLTVGNKNGFLESGGMVNMIEKDNRIKFEVNRPLSTVSGLSFRSQLLRHAVRTKPKRSRSGDSGDE